MAKKYALYLPYKVLDSLSSGNVTDSQFREFIMGLAEYDRSGMFPASRTAGFTMMYELLKPDLDFAKAKYEDIVEKRRQAGKLGGARPGNQNAKKDTSKSEKQKQAKQANQAKQADNSSKYTVVSNQMTDIRSSSKSEVVFSKQLTTTFSNFYISEQKARELCTDIDPSWLSGIFTYPEYIAEAIQENYSDKPQDEKTKLFITLFSAEDRKAMFPQWRQEQETTAAKQETRRYEESVTEEHNRKIEALKKDGPQKCGNCGAAIEAPNSIRGECPSCGYYYFLNEENEAWEFNEPFNLSEALKRIHQKKSNIVQPEEIDF